MKDWRKLKKGDLVHMHTEEFDGIGDWDGVITDVSADHAIMTEADGSRNWIDDDTAYLFRRVKAAAL